MLKPPQPGVRTQHQYPNEVPQHYPRRSAIQPGQMPPGVRTGRWRRPGGGDLDGDDLGSVTNQVLALREHLIAGVDRDGGRGPWPRGPWCRRWDGRANESSTHPRPSADSPRRRSPAVPGHSGRYVAMTALLTHEGPDVVVNDAKPGKRIPGWSTNSETFERRARSLALNLVSSA